MSSIAVSFLYENRIYWITVRDGQTFKSIKSKVIGTIQQGWPYTPMCEDAVLSAYNSYRLSRIENALHLKPIKYTKKEPVCPSVTVDELKKRFNELVELNSTENREVVEAKLKETKDWLLECEEYRNALIYITHITNKNGHVDIDKRALKKHKSIPHTDIKNLLKSAVWTVDYDMKTKLTDFIIIAYALFKDNLYERCELLLK